MQGKYTEKNGQYEDTQHSYYLSPRRKGEREWG